MFDLNEIPEQPANDVGAENGGNALATDRVNAEDPTASCKAFPLLSPSTDGGGNLASATPMEAPTAPTPKRSVPASLSLEMTSTKRPNISTSLDPALWQQDLETGDHRADDAMAVEGFTSSLLQSLSNHHHQHHQRLSDVKSGKDLINDTPKVAYHFLGESSEDASTSRAPERFQDGDSRNDQGRGLTGNILSLNNTFELQAPSEGSEFGLSLGGIFRESPLHGAVDVMCKGSKGPDPYANPFWFGKLQTDDAPLLTPIVAYCLGITTPDWRLKKLPSILSLKGFLKLEELERILHKGLAEALIQFKPSKEASAEEVKRFHSMVKSLSIGSEPYICAALSGPGMGLQEHNPASLAALISWEEDSLDAKLCLISFPSIQGVLKFCKSSLILGALEDVNALDPESLYGIIFHSASGALNERIDSLSKSQQAGRTATPSNKILITPEAIKTPAERGRETETSNRTSSPSNKKYHVTRSDLLSKSASMEPIRASNRDDFDIEEAGRGTRRRYQKQLSAIEKSHEASGRYHSRHGNGTRDVDEDDIGTLNPQQSHLKQRERLKWNNGRPSQRQDWWNERLKDSFRRNKDDKDSYKQRAKEHERHSYHDSEKGKGLKSQVIEGDQHRDLDKPRHKERERSKDRTAENLKRKAPSEKGLTGSKNKSSFSHRVSPDQDMGKIKKKRDREGEKEHVASVKRSRESETTASHHSEELVKNTSCDLKCKPEAEQTKDPSPEKETVLVAKSDLRKPNTNTPTLDSRLSNHGRCDDLVEGIAMDSHVLNEKTTPLQKRGSDDELIGITNEPIGASVTMLGASAINTKVNPLVLSCDRNGTAEDGAVSKSDETLGDPSLDKVKDEKEDIGVEFSLDVFDKETRTWLMSKQNAFYLKEEFGVHFTVNPELSNCEIDSKADTQTGPLQVKISVIPSEPCDAAENKWFLDQAAAVVKTIASQGVFVKCLWYEGPVQIHPGDGAPSVPVIVKKIKGEDGKNLERMQDMTGVMIGVVLRKCGTGAPHEMEPVSRPRFIGLRLKCVRRKGLLEALKETEALLESVADHFSKELATHIATHIVDLQASTFHLNEASSKEGSPSTAIVAKEFLPNLPVKEEESPASCKPDEVAVLASTQDVANKVCPSKDEPKHSLQLEQEIASRPLYVSNLSDHMTPIKIQNIFENVLKAKLEPLAADLEGLSELVADVRYIPDKSCAFVVLANDGLLNATLKLYAEDKTVFQGMSVELNPSEQESAFSRLGARNMGSSSGLHGKAALLALDEEENNGRTRDAFNNDFSDCSNDQWYAENAASRTESFPGRPRPLFLSELMRNASAPALKQLFEDIIRTYIGTSPVSAGGRQLVLDVRYVPSRGCAFVDLATPELVEFMLDLHSRRPEVFMNMKMELGRKAVAYSAEEDTGGRLNIRLHGKPNLSSQTFGYRLSSASRKKMEKRNGSFNLEDSDKGDDPLWLNARMKKQRSDPEKTIYADRLPENASEGMIKKIFERVLLQKLPQEEMDALGEHMITEVRHVPSKYCAFVVFATEDLTRTVLHMFNQDEDVFESMRLKPHFHSRMEDLYKDDLQDIDEIFHSASFRERMVNLDNDHGRARQLDIHEYRARSAAHRAITASAFREVDRRRSVYVDKIPEDLSEATMTEMFERVFRRKHGHDGPMVSQVAYFRDKFDSSKLCAFVEVKTEDATQDLVDFYNSNQDAFHGMRVRPGFKYTN